MLQPAAAGRSNFYHGTDPSKIGFNDPFFQKGKLGRNIFSVKPGESIQKRINEANERGGGIVYLDVGTYYLNSDLTLYSNVILEGSGFASTIIDFSGGPYSARAEGKNAYSTGTVTTVKSSPTITGSGTSWTSDMEGRSILLDGNMYTVVTVVSATSITLDFGVITNSASGLSYVIADFIASVYLRNLTLANSSVNLLETRYGFLVSLNLVDLDGGVIGWNCQDTFAPQFINCNAYNGTNGIKFTNCYFYTMGTWFVFNCSGDGVILTTGGNSTMYDFSVSNCGGRGIAMTDTNILTLVAFTLDSHVSHGVEFISGCNKISFNGGFINSNGGDGIKLTATDDKNSFSQLQLVDNTGYGLNIAAATCDNNIIIGNSFSGNTAGAVNNSGTGTVVNDNTGIGAQFFSTATDNFRINTFTNTPNPNWEVGVGNGAGALDTTKAFIFGTGSSVGVNTIVPASTFSVAGVSGGQIGINTNSELLTVAAAATSVTSTNLLPSGAIVLAVTCRVTTVIPTATSFTLKSTTDNVVFTNAVGVAAGSTSQGTTHWAATTSKLSTADQTITLTIAGSNPANNTGRVRIVVYYMSPTPPTS